MTNSFDPCIILGKKVQFRHGLFDTKGSIRSMETIFDMIRQPNEAVVSKIKRCRKTHDKDARDELKKFLPRYRVSINDPSVTRSAKVTDKIYTGIIILDLDQKGFKGRSQDDVLVDLKKDKHVFSIHRGPSSNELYSSLKMMIFNPHGMTYHTTTFNKMYSHLEEHYGVLLDTSGKDLVRNTYLSHDPDLFINMHYTPFDLTDLNVSVKEVNISNKSAPKVAASKKVPLKELDAYEIEQLDAVEDICSHFINGLSYGDWVNIAYALTSTYGHSAHESRAFQAFSLIGSEMDTYDPQSVEKTWSSCRDNNRETVNVSYLFRFIGSHLAARGA